MSWMHQLLACGLIILTLFTSCTCNHPNEDNPAGELIEDLTDSELEQICTSRGFELVKDTDKETGQPKQYSHDDYIDAAKQCLEIEAEMEQILSENPSLLDDIESEAQKMREEKERLEKELAKAKEKLLIERNSTDEQHAFIKSMSADEIIFNSVDNIENFPSQHMYDVDVDDEDNEIIDLDTDIEKKNQTKNGPVTDRNETILENKESALVTDGNETLRENRSSASTNDSNEQYSENKDPSSVVDGPPFAESPIGEKPTKGSIFDAGEIFQEFRDQISKDISRVKDIILRGPLKDTFGPAIRISRNTATTAINLLKKYIFVILNKKAEQRDNKETETGVSSKETQT